MGLHFFSFFLNEIRKMAGGKTKAKDDVWCRHCPRSDYQPHPYPAHAKVNLPAVPHGKLPPTGRSQAMQSGVGEPTVWEKADALLKGNTKSPEDGCGYERFVQKRNRPWNYYLPLTKPMAESVLIEDSLNPNTRWVLSYNWLNRGFYPCCDRNNPAGSGNAQIVRRDGFLYPIDDRPVDTCPPSCTYCDKGDKCKKCPNRPPPATTCPKAPKDKCKKVTYEGDQVRAPLYKERNKEM